ncbi:MULTISPECIES: molybdate ABC transporter substrate-binding protein [unclassified Oceanobacter]|uniref:molybdate ABC transporter substrate-binding protein n=1 Tax=unclassified Oceanobacter TaxID=2620260 RepID=UPI002736BA9E|nr:MULTISPECIES: molybdate ABC transporter substrate-binding protein [unclassified Oceanobacter]MDP2608146.1 molybdate ABC transporter substrate-binding protein [Oceanobacter sp. 1_MG-2023]MDP2611192.1 molybdate ABC transporter substrate-binding protein [Oceanobacter sp. 2_MG-2023]
MIAKRTAFSTLLKPGNAQPESHPQRAWIIRRSALMLALTLGLSTVQADTVSVAVAANFTAPMKQIAADFEKKTGHVTQLSFGSSGKFVAQIKNGAPFEVFLSADQQKPVVLEKAGISVANSRFSYALGRLALWTIKPDTDPLATLHSGKFNKLAIANPRLAPYGLAATQVLEEQGLTQKVKSKLVQGDNIAQTWQFASTGNADLGFVALSQISYKGNIKEGKAWVVPLKQHDPIRQDAVLLQKGANNQAAKELLQYLQSKPAHVIIRQYGYEIPQ